MQASSLRKGTVIIHNGIPHRVMEFQHSTPGNLRARVQTKLRNLFSGSQTEVRFGATENVQEADVMNFSATYLYNDADGYHFMNSQSYEQFAVTEAVMGDGKYYLQDQMKVDIMTFEGNPISVSLPASVVLTIADTAPEFKGATASNSPKPAKTETGLALSVPTFIKVGEKVVVSTVDGTYLSRADK